LYKKAESFEYEMVYVIDLLTYKSVTCNRKLTSVNISLAHMVKQNLPHQLISVTAKAQVKERKLCEYIIPKLIHHL
jgi:hypothetical protein